VLEEVDAVGVGEQRERHLAKLVHTLPIAFAAAVDPGRHHCVAEGGVLHLVEQITEQRLDVLAVDHGPSPRAPR